MSNVIVRKIAESEYCIWDKFVKESPQGTIFHSSTWIEAIKFAFGLKSLVYGYFIDNIIHGGYIATIENHRFIKYLTPPPLTPYSGLLIHEMSDATLSNKTSSNFKITKELLNNILINHENIILVNHYTLIDIRPFIWNGWDTNIKYTLITNFKDEKDIDSIIDSSAKYEIRKAKKNGINVNIEMNINKFCELYEKTYSRQKINPPVNLNQLTNLIKYLHDKEVCTMYCALDKNNNYHSCSLILWDNKRSYYFMGASDPNYRNSGASSLILFNAFKDLANDLNEIDLVGANKSSISKFKQDFATEIKPYYVITKYNSKIPKLTKTIKHLFNK